MIAKHMQRTGVILSFSSLKGKKLSITVAESGALCFNSDHSDAQVNLSMEAGENSRKKE